MRSPAEHNRHLRQAAHDVAALLDTFIVWVDPDTGCWELDMEHPGCALLLRIQSRLWGDIMALWN